MRFFSDGHFFHMNMYLPNAKKRMDDEAHYDDNVCFSSDGCHCGQLQLMSLQQQKIEDTRRQNRRDDEPIIGTESWHHHLSHGS